MKIQSLGYVGIGAPDPKVWQEFATNIIGLMPARACAGEDWGIPAVLDSGPASAGSGISENGSVFLKMDEWQWRIAVHPDQENRGILYIGFQLQSLIDLQCAVKELQAEHIPVRFGSDTEARSRSVSGIAYTQDPTGNMIELFYGPTIDKHFESPLGMEFKAGNLGLGHLNLLVPNLEDAKDFYTRILGFELTDYIRFGEQNSANFFHCNGRHHSIGLTRVGNVKGLHHLMLEVDSYDNVCQCLERVVDAGINITSTLGRHTNDNVFSFYMSSPYGFEVEIGCNGVMVDQDWVPHEFVNGDLWGHRGLDPETITRNLAKLASKGAER
ncbi:VOC family protein [Zhongshania aquimaris]|uniref:VOC family protein n=1 Tax=Zhongshania aquimaris TaxID=2857107 RepID=A0ABS6VNL4_9GAMM|nr:VOC family protein [Zhongshania aquimaris]MBW2939905.1 VOC family protein [Zhongshania aquimaris]